MTSNIATIKLEEEQESVTEIQTYLETFNKEIEEGQELQHVQLQQVEGLSNVEDGTYFVGDAYQTVTVVPSDSREVSYILIVQQPESEEKERKSTEELIAALTETATVEKEEVEGEQDLTVYDFKDNEDNEAPVESETEEDKAKIIKLLPKKSQTVTLTQQAHMCNYCNYTSPKRYLLSRHMKSHSEERPHKCSVCERGFKTLASLQNHVNTHTGTKPRRCKFCDSAFTTSGELVRHVRYRHTHEKPHKCHECDYASVELSKLKRHIRCHTVGNKPVFKCELCPATCGRKTDLRTHVQKLHTSDKALKCKRCRKTFLDRYNYKLHSKTHEGEKCYKCDLCPYASISVRHLESHMFIHTDQKPYQCDHCIQSFRQKQLLKRHCNLYHNPSYVPPPPQEKSHQCPECERAFRHKGNLIRHMAVHDPESSLQEKQQALKIGRQKKIQIIDGQRVEVMTVTTGDLANKLKGYDEDDDEEIEEDNEDNMITVEGTDGQQYVVLEVVQLEDNQGTDQMTVVANEDGEFIMQDPLSEESYIVIGTGEEEEEDMKQNNPKLQKEMETCFGFDEEKECA